MRKIETPKPSTYNVRPIVYFDKKIEISMLQTVMAADLPQDYVQCVETFHLRMLLLALEVCVCDERFCYRYKTNLRGVIYRMLVKIEKNSD